MNWSLTLFLLSGAALAGGAGPRPAVRPAAPAPMQAASSVVEWPSYNRTLTSDRFVPLTEINKSNVSRLKPLCTFDTGETLSFQTGLVQVDGQLFGTTIKDIFSINPDTCKLNWRTHEEYPNAKGTNRGVAYLDGRLFRGTQDGRVLAYDAKTGKRLWATKIAFLDKGESVPSAPIAWNGLVYIGNAGGDKKGVKGRMYGLDAKTGKIVWEAYMLPRTAGDLTLGPPAKQAPGIAETWGNAKEYPISGGGNWTSYSLDPETGILYVPGGNPAPDFRQGVRPGDNLFTGAVAALDAKTGDYRAAYKMVVDDFHDWDVSSASTIVTTKAGRKLLATAPKDGLLYGHDLKTGEKVYETPVTTRTNVDVPLSETEAVRFCPGVKGGSEWNGPAYEPRLNLLMVPEVDWCATMSLGPIEALHAIPGGATWSGADPDAPFGVDDPAPAGRKGRLSAVDADTGEVKWEYKSATPLLSGVTPTASGLVFFGDLDGNLFAFDSATGQKLWSSKVDGGLGGGVISYATKAGQRVAVAAGLSSEVWKAGPHKGKVVIFGLR